MKNYIYIHIYTHKKKETKMYCEGIRITVCEVFEVGIAISMGKKGGGGKKRGSFQIIYSFIYLNTKKSCMDVIKSLKTFYKSKVMNLIATVSLKHKID